MRLLEIVEILWKLHPIHYDVLRAIERYLRRYLYVPKDRIIRATNIKSPKIDKVLEYLLRLKLIEIYEGKYTGYSLTYAGLDALALHDLGLTGKITRVGPKLGVGKEADIHVAYLDNEPRIIKLYRIKPSFKQIRKYRDYALTAKNWYELVIKCAKREFYALRKLYKNNVRVPRPITMNRHIILMEYIDGTELIKARLVEPLPIFEAIVDEIVKMLKVGIVHCDLSEYNILVTVDGDVCLIDFPQWVSLKHPNASEFLKKDLLQIIRYFHRKYHISLKKLIEIASKKLQEAGYKIEVE